MIDEAQLVERLQSVGGVDWTVQTMDDSRYALFSSASAHFDVQVGPRYDGQFAVVAVQQTDFDSIGSVTYPLEYRRAEAGGAAVDAVAEIVSKYDDSQPLSTNAIESVASIETVVEHLVEMGVEFVAVPEDLLAYGVCSFVWAASGEPDESAVTEYLRGLDTVTIGGHPLPFVGAAETGPLDAHFGTRVPVYSSGKTAPAMDRLEPEHGLANLRTYDFSASPESELPIEPQATSLETLLKQLVDAGAVAIGLEKGVSRPDHLAFVVNLPPAVGYDIVAPYTTIEFSGKERDVDWVCDVGGPHFTSRVPVYASDDIVGMDSVSLSEGIATLQTYVLETDVSQSRAGDAS